MVANQKSGSQADLQIVRRLNVDSFFAAHFASFSACAGLGISQLRFPACGVPNMQDVHAARLLGDIIENAVRAEDNFA
jgi:hypothetical protein